MKNNCRRSMRVLITAMALLLAAALLMVLPSTAIAVVQQWDFSLPADYTYDPAKVEISGGDAHLVAAADWLDPNWSYRKQLTVDNTSNPQDLTEYQARVDIYPAEADFWSHVRSDGADIRFTQGDGVTPVDFFVQDFDYSSQMATAWVQVPLIPASSIAQLYLYYGNPAAASISNVEATFSYAALTQLYYVNSSQEAGVDLWVASYSDGNQVWDGTSSLFLDKQGVGVFPGVEIGQQTAISSLKPISGRPNSSNGCETLAPVCFAGTAFAFASSRGSDVWHVYSPFGNATVSIYNGSAAAPLVTFVVPQGTSVTQAADVTTVGIVQSDMPVLVKYRAGTTDAELLYPMCNDLYGVSSNSSYLTALEDNTTVQVYASGGGNNTVVVNRGDRYTIGYGGSQGSGQAIHLVADKAISATSQADSDGSEAMAFWPPGECSYEYILPTDAQYLAIACLKSSTYVQVYDTGGSLLDEATSSGPAPPYPQKLFFGSPTVVTYTAGTRIVGTQPFFVYYEHDNQDESNLLSYLQGRKQAYPEPSSSLGAEQTPYPSDNPTVEPVAGQYYTALSSFTETATKPVGTEIRYQLSHNGALWYWWDSATWTPAVGYGQSNDASEVDSNISQFASQFSPGTLYFRAFLHSDGAQQIRLDEISIDFSAPPLVDAGADKSCLFHESIKPFADADFSDPYGQVDHAYYDIEGSGWTEIPQGAYPSLKDAVRDFSYTFHNLGDITCWLRVEDNHGETAQASLDVQVRSYQVGVNAGVDKEAIQYTDFQPFEDATLTPGPAAISNVYVRIGDGDWTEITPLIGQTFQEALRAYSTSKDQSGIYQCAVKAVDAFGVEGQDSCQVEVKDYGVGPSGYYEWYFAEGSTREGFDEWLCIMNPKGEEAEVNIQYMFGGTEMQGQQITLPPQFRFTILVNSVIGPDKDVSIKVTSPDFIVVERVMYFDYQGVWQGGHVSSGSKTPANSWYFAEGTTREGFDEWLCIMNPNSVQASMDISFLLDNGERLIQEWTVSPYSRSTLFVPLVVGRGRDVSIEIVSDYGIVAERSMYFDYEGKCRGGTVGRGMNTAATWMIFANITTEPGSDSWLSIGNPGDETAFVNASYKLDDGTSFERIYMVEANRRLSIWINQELGQGRLAYLEINSDTPVAAECPRYFYGNWPEGGDQSQGTRLLFNTWYLAEGTTRQGFDEWLYLLNPGQNLARVEVKYLLYEEEAITRVYLVEPESWLKINVRGEIGEGKDVSVEVNSDQPIEIERQIYFIYQGVWPGVHSSSGFVNHPL